jgi:hypothetical protein
MGRMDGEEGGREVVRKWMERSPSILSILLTTSSPSFLSIHFLTTSLLPSSSSLPLSLLPLDPHPHYFSSLIPLHPLPHYLSPSFLSIHPSHYLSSSFLSVILLLNFPPGKPSMC